MTEEDPTPLGRSKLAPALDALRAVDARATLNLKVAVPALVIAIVSFAIGDRLGGTERTTAATFTLFGGSVTMQPTEITFVVLGFTLLFAVAGIVATRSAGREIARVSSIKGGAAAASAIRLICYVVGYLTVIIGVLGLLRVNLGNLLVGGAVTGVVVGIAAQQTLGNFFAGLVLLFARPYVPGQRIKIRTGAMGGPFEGVILTAGLMYTVIDTDEGPVNMPNSGLLAAAIGPAPKPATDA